MSGKYTTRVNIPMTDELRGEYQAAADAVGLDLTTWVREWLQEGVPTMRAIVAARQQGGVGPLQVFMRQVLADAQAATADFDEEHKPEGKTA